MARKAKPKRQNKPSRLRRWWGDLPQRRRKEISGRLMRVCVVVAVAGVLVAGAKVLESAVLSSTGLDSSKVAYNIELRPIPEWMPKTLSQEIARSLDPQGMRFGDPRLTAAIYALAEGNPWISKACRVRKRRDGGPDGARVEVRVEFRQPYAKVQRSDLRGYVYVDPHAVALPDPPDAPQVPKWRVKVAGAQGKGPRWVYFAAESEIPASLHGAAKRIQYVIVQGVRSIPPAPGQTWRVADLAAGLKLIGLIAARRYRNEITAVDVRNHGGRLSPTEPHLRMFAQLGSGRTTYIRFGRLPAGDGDFVVSPARKMSYLDDWAGRHNGRIAGTCRWIDLRYDEIHHSID